MRFKLDENLGKRCVELFNTARHDVATANEQALSAAIAESIAQCRDEGRALVTLDLDLSIPITFAPAQYRGIAVRHRVRSGRSIAWS